MNQNKWLPEVRRRKEDEGEEEGVEEVKKEQ